jgi:hypothetical protein
LTTVMSIPFLILIRPLSLNSIRAVPPFCMFGLVCPPCKVEDIWLRAAGLLRSTTWANPSTVVDFPIHVDMPRDYSLAASKELDTDNIWMCGDFVGLMSLCTAIIQAIVSS